MKIGLVQAAACRDVQRNLESVRHYAAAAGKAGCRAVCFPECFLTGYFPGEREALALAADGPETEQVCRLAKDLGVDILVGFMEKAGGRYHISHGLFCRTGIREIYRKTHPGQRERQFFTPGEALKVFSLSDGMKIGIQLCVETHYPEITQTLALRGAEVIFAPHAVPRISGDRKAIWEKYIPARSYDNRVYLACCNLWDENRFGGGCMVTGPRGEITAACFEGGPSLLVWEADRELTASFRDPQRSRSRHFFPGLRRKELYD